MATCFKLAHLVSALTLSLICFASSAYGTTDTLVHCLEASPSFFNPQLATDGPTFTAASRTIYNRLLDFEPGSTKLVSSLATSWNISKDGKEVTFKLRKGVKFHSRDEFRPTRDFSADDVVWTFNRMRDEKHPYHLVNGGTYEYFKSMSLHTLIADIVKIDEHTVKFRLIQPESTFLSNMAMDFAAILSAEYAGHLSTKNTPEKIDFEPVGTGPFTLTRYTKDTDVRFNAFPEYFAGKNPMNKLVMAIVKDPSVRLQKLKKGECHVMADPSPADLATIRADKKLKLVEADGLNVGYLSMNITKKPFDQLEVRQAINHALNKSEYIKAIYLGTATPAKNPIPPSLWSYNTTIKDYAHDPAKAKDLLTKAGLPNGFETTLWYMPVSRPYMPNAKKIAEMMQADLAKIGVKAKLISYDWSTYLEKARKGEHDLLILGWIADNGDPDNFMGNLLSCAGVEGGSNYSRWCDKKFDDLIKAAKVAPTVKARTKIYMDAQKVFKEQAPWVTLAHAKMFRGVSSNVVNYHLNPLGTDNLYGVKLK